MEALHEARRLNYGQAAKHAIYVQNRRGANKRGLLWDITEEEFCAIGQLPCRYCGCLKSNFAKSGYGIYGEYRYNGVDRLNSALGYTLENCAPCCWKCNRAKNRMDEAEFMAWVRQVYSYRACSYTDCATDFEI